ncbi:MAG TPA: hypothetical protein VES20_04130 [Bryobacteraceae bacterium]|nr:hypothetical protein [Bryobacteraceae bacterium]
MGVPWGSNISGPMVTGKAKLDPVMNDLFPHVQPTTVSEFLLRLT